MVSFTSIIVSAAFAATALAKGGFNFAPSVHILRARETTAPSASSSSDLEFAACQQAVTSLSPKPTYIIYSNRTVDINGLPAICISQMNTHNAAENVAQTNKWEGWGLVLNDTAIQTSGTGNSLTAWLDENAVNIS